MTSNKTHNWTRFYQIFSSKIVLEVFGGGGAIWGFSEVCTLRNPITQEQWRLYAQVIGFTFFIRFILQMKGFIGEIGGKVCTIDKEKSSYRFLQIFAAKLVLEVFGGGGAIWGFSEALTLRVPETQEFWRLNASVVGAIFFVRFLFQCKDYITQMNGQSLLFDYNSKSMIRGWQVFSGKLVLEFFGGAGAIWGFSEVLTLRRPATQILWRFIALIVGFVFYTRFICQIKDFGFESKYVDNLHDEPVEEIRIKKREPFEVGRNEASPLIV